MDVRIPIKSMADKRKDTSEFLDNFQKIAEHNAKIRIMNQGKNNSSLSKVVAQPTPHADPKLEAIILPPKSNLIPDANLFKKPKIKPVPKPESAKIQDVMAKIDIRNFPKPKK